MSGTAITESEEFFKIYKLDVVSIPTNLEYNTTRSDSKYVIVDAKDEHGYKYTYFAHRGDGGKAPVLLAAQGLPGCCIPYRRGQAARHNAEIVNIT
jgi:preprotein translocase subunit SecA